MHSNPVNVDYLIIGQGLAGSLLAWTLHQQNKKVYIVDNHHKHSSSKVAAGLINPVIGKRLNIDEDVQAYLNDAIVCYQALASQFDQTFFHPQKMLRLFKDEQQMEAFKKKASNNELENFFGQKFTPEENIKPLQNTYGGTYQKQTGYLDTSSLIKSLQAYFLKEDILYQGKLSYKEIILNDDSVHWKNIQAKQCIFCEGYQATDNPWFNWLPFQLAKGEIISIESEEPLTTHIINKGQWLIPLSNKKYKTGATNEWDFENDNISSTGKKQLKEKFEALFEEMIDYKITHHEAGIRPTTLDKKPFIGLHPKHKQLGIFNGFGARGSLTIPYHVNLFINSLNNHISLPSDIDINRYDCQ